MQREHFNENYLQTTKYPKATFTGNILNMDGCVSDCELDITAKGVLSIHGKTKVLTLPVHLRRTGEKLQANADFEVELADFDIDIPLILEGKISPVIDVSVSIDFDKKRD